MIKILIILISFSALSETLAAETRRLLDLRGRWKFEIGDDAKWANADYDDSDWDKIFVPSFWEDEGFPSYDGYAWYRTSFKLEKQTDASLLLLRLGQIDDVDEVFLNGRRVGGSGSFPPDFRTAYNHFREYMIPTPFFNLEGENVIAIRVYDSQLEGGITGNQIGIYERMDGMDVAIELAGSWKFRIGDNIEWHARNLDDSEWADIIVPGNWENQGYQDYNGYAWYRTTFYMPRELADEKLVLLLGKIDDLDETYVNGERIGRTGDVDDPGNRNDLGDYWQETRAYFVPADLLDPGGENTISVKVYDGFQGGGIFEGPIGISKRSVYREWDKMRKRDEGGSFWYWLLNQRQREAKQEEGARTLWNWLTGDDDE